MALHLKNMGSLNISLTAIDSLYNPAFLYKDPGQISCGLSSLGCFGSMITIPNKDIEKYDSPVPIKIVTPSSLSDYKFWKEEKSNFIIIYGWFNSLTPVIRAAKASGKKIIIKGDTDGLIGFGYPLIRDFFWGTRSVKNILAAARTYLPIGSLYREKINQIDIADGVIVETPEALFRVSYFLTYWNHSELIPKVHFIPNPVTPDIINAKVCSAEERENLIVAIGRWEDIAQKNTYGLLNSLYKFLEIRKNYRAVIIGSGEDFLKKELAKYNCSDRIAVKGTIKHEEIKNYLSKGKILFMPSRWEGSSIAAAESVCMGCSIVGGPLACLNFLTAGGEYGTLAENFKKMAFISALLADAQKWDDGFYNSISTAEFWRLKLNRAEVVNDIVGLCNKLK